MKWRIKGASGHCCRWHWQVFRPDGKLAGSFTKWTTAMRFANSQGKKWK